MVPAPATRLVQSLGVQMKGGYTATLATVHVNQISLGTPPQLSACHGRSSTTREGICCVHLRGSQIGSLVFYRNICTDLDLAGFRSRSQSFEKVPGIELTQQRIRKSFRLFRVWIKPISFAGFYRT